MGAGELQLLQDCKWRTSLPLPGCCITHLAVPSAPPSAKEGVVLVVGCESGLVMVVGEKAGEMRCLSRYAIHIHRGGGSMVC